MNEDYSRREWADHRAHASSALAALFGAVEHAFERLHAQQYHAPWKRETTARCASNCPAE